MNAPFNGERVAALMRAEQDARALERLARQLAENLKDLQGEPEQMTDKMGCKLYGDARQMRGILQNVRDRILDMP